MYRVWFPDTQGGSSPIRFSGSIMSISACSRTRGISLAMGIEKIWNWKFRGTPQKLMVYQFITIFPIDIAILVGIRYTHVYTIFWQTGFVLISWMTREQACGIWGAVWYSHRWTKATNQQLETGPGLGNKPNAVLKISSPILRYIHFSSTWLNWRDESQLITAFRQPSHLSTYTVTQNGLPREVVRMTHLLQFSASYRLLPTLTDSYRLLPTLTGSYRLLPTLTDSYRLLPTLTDSYRLLPHVLLNGRKNKTSPWHSNHKHNKTKQAERKEFNWETPENGSNQLEDPWSLTHQLTWSTSGVDLVTENSPWLCQGTGWG